MVLVIILMSTFSSVCVSPGDRVPATGVVVTGPASGLADADMLAETLVPGTLAAWPLGSPVRSFPIPGMPLR